jgi:hypothetical protein
MKSFLLAAFAVLLFASCSRNSYPSTPQPVPGDPRYPDQSRRYPDPYPAPSDNRTYPADYPREGERDVVVTIVRTGNANYEHLPPGQAKKKYGGQSAKVYAPGQQKKNGGYNNGMATVIAVSDIYASPRSNSGQLYYIYRGNTYWKQNDGYYYLAENNNERNYQNGNKHKDKEHGNRKGKERDEDRDDD